MGDEQKSKNKMKLYHYTTLDSFAKIWVSKQLMFSPSQNTNDMFEREKLFHILHQFMYDLRPSDFNIPIMEYWKSFNAILYGFKQISLVADYNDTPGYKSPLMWGHYAHNDKGVCIEFDSEKLPKHEDIYSSKVSYVTKVPFVDIPKPIRCGKNEIRNLILENQETFFFTKHKHWEHENEFRIVSDTKETLSVDQAITCVYVADCHHVNTKVVEQLVRDEVHIQSVATYKFSNSHGRSNIDLTAMRAYERKWNKEPLKSEMQETKKYIF